MDKLPLRATPGEGMHSILRIKSAPDSAQIRIHLMADSNMRQEEGQRRPTPVFGAGGSRMDCVTGALPVSPSSSPSMWSRWAESEAQVLRSEWVRQLRHGSDRSESPRRPGRRGGARWTWRRVQCERPLQIRPDRYVYRDDASCCAAGRTKQTGQSSRPLADQK